MMQCRDLVRFPSPHETLHVPQFPQPENSSSPGNWKLEMRNDSFASELANLLHKTRLKVPTIKGGF